MFLAANEDTVKAFLEIRRGVVALIERDVNIFTFIFMQNCDCECWVLFGSHNESKREREREMDKQTEKS